MCVPIPQHNRNALNCNTLQHHCQEQAGPRELPACQNRNLDSCQALPQTVARRRNPSSQNEITRVEQNSTRANRLSLHVNCGRMSLGVFGAFALFGPHHQVRIEIRHHHLFPLIIQRKFILLQ